MKAYELNQKAEQIVLKDAFTEQEKQKREEKRVVKDAYNKAYRLKKKLEKQAEI